MMKGGESPKRNSQPLLSDETTPTAGPRMGAYEPPASSSWHQPDFPPHASPATTSHGGSSDGYDLHLSATDASGNVIPSASEDDEDLPQLPPLVSYCSFVRYGCAFSKWLLLVAVVNMAAFGICAKDRYFHFNRYWPVDTWKGGLLACVWLGTAVFLFWAAKVVENEVQRVDHMAQYEQGRVSEDTNSTSHNVAAFVPSYEHIYGQVSRKIDAMFIPKRSSSSSNAAPPEGTSSLVNLSFAFWSIFFAAAVFLGTGVVLGKHYQSACDPKNLPNATSGSSSKDFSYISKYPNRVQEWITELRNPWGYGLRVNYQDDDINDDFGHGASTYDFPTAMATDIGAIAVMKDGTLFFAGLAPVQTGGSANGDNDAGYVYSNHLVLVESPGNGGAVRYYEDIVNPRMFVPVKNTMVKNDQGNFVATQYCFTSAKDESERKKNKRSWDNIIRYTPMNCIITKSGAIGTNSSKFSIERTNIYWKDKSRRGPQVTAASSGGEILIAHVGTDDRNQYQEVVSLTPSSMEYEPVHHLTSGNADFNGWERDRRHQNTACIQDHVQVFSIIAALVVLILCGLWLILREGVPAGMSPLVFALVGLLRCVTGKYDGGMRIMALTFGTLFLHGVLCCENGRVCHLPAWIGRDLYVWALYSWTLSFFAIDLIFGMSDAFIWGSIFFGLSGVILNHPIPHLMGYTSILLGIFQFIVGPFFGIFRHGFLMGALCLFLGLGMLGAGTCLSHNRRFCVALCRPMSQAGRTMFYGSAAPGRVANAPPSTDPVTAQV